ncbi:hypothetical protein [Streptomyces sp. NPDC001978]|uniref:hypothetical protein n=1 Tax=Streptomyces sp. NPDC001978 TaxID=3364627 RepID=UPI0036A3BA72
MTSLPRGPTSRTASVHREPRTTRRYDRRRHLLHRTPAYGLAYRLAISEVWIDPSEQGGLKLLAC